MKKRNLIICLFSILFVLIMLLVILEKSNFIDDNIYNFIISNRDDFLDNYFKLITKLGNVRVVLVVILLFIFLFRNKYSLYIMICSISSVFLNTILKFLVRRERPNILRLIEQGGYSFPSGHAMISICLYGYLLYLAYTKINNKILKYSVSIILILIIISIGISRIYLGVHYASDVIAGYLLATIYVMIFVIATENINNKIKNKVRGNNNV